jgi:hypothetical protein
MEGILTQQRDLIYYPRRKWKVGRSKVMNLRSLILIGGGVENWTQSLKFVMIFYVIMDTCKFEEFYLLGCNMCKYRFTLQEVTNSWTKTWKSSRDGLSH